MELPAMFPGPHTASSPTLHLTLHPKHPGKQDEGCFPRQ